VAVEKVVAAAAVARAAAKVVARVAVA